MVCLRAMCLANMAAWALFSLTVSCKNKTKNGKIIELTFRFSKFRILCSIITIACLIGSPASVEACFSKLEFATEGILHWQQLTVECARRSLKLAGDFELAAGHSKQAGNLRNETKLFLSVLITITHKSDLNPNRSIILSSYES